MCSAGSTAACARAPCSYYRCVAVHGTSNTSVSENVLFDVIGHCVYLEDGVEENNKITYNLAALVRQHAHPLAVYCCLNFFWATESMYE
eukprot:4157975-Pleurochrysis_carterae.AAC.2